MFKFNFGAEYDLEEMEDSEETPLPDSKVSDPSGVEADNIADEFAEVPLQELLDAMPSMISYTPLPILFPGDPTRGLSLPRRDLFDARFQLISTEEQGEDGDENEPTLIDFLDAPSDLIPGVYEGGLKTWECSVDLAAHLASIVSSKSADWIRGKTILEVGCGTAIPSLYLLHELFQNVKAPVESPLTTFHFQDYNRSALELMTVPNILLTWYLSPASSEYRQSETESESEPGETPDESIPSDTALSEVSITPSFISAFTTSLSALRISLCLFTGSWASWNTYSSSGQKPKPYDLVFTSETIYRIASLPSLVFLLRSSTALNQEREGRGMCLVAAKLVYFGVGGGVIEFTKAVKDMGGRVDVVREMNEGVGRAVMDVVWG